jgi:tRNA uridine 5-carbamoylmethylation protein Kti12
VNNDRQSKTIPGDIAGAIYQKGKKMKIILLTGKPKSGKTATFKVLYNKMTQGMAEKPIKKRILNSRYDFECEMKYNDKEVALFSLGDIMYMVYEAIIKYSEKDYLILAHSQGGSQMDRIKESVKKYKQHCVIDKTVSKPNASQQTKDADNMKDCQRIIAAIK